MQPRGSSLETSSELYRIMSGASGAQMELPSSSSCYYPPYGGGLELETFCGSSSFYPLEVVSSEITDTPQARALAALKNHKEAEKRRRERINSHLDKLRTILPCSTKTDKATLLAKVVQRVKELKFETSEITNLETFPSETDEVTVYSTTDGGRLIFKASMCCEDRSDLMPELAEILKSLRLKTLRAEMSTLGGRIRNVLIVAADNEHNVESVHFLQNALKGLVQRSSNYNNGCKRRRVVDRKTTLS